MYMTLQTASEGRRRRAELRRLDGLFLRRYATDLCQFCLVLIGVIGIVIGLYQYHKKK